MNRGTGVHALRMLMMGAMCLLLLSGPVQGEDEAEFGERLQALREKAMKASRDLVRSMLPKPEDLGPAWKYPWQLPSSVRSSVGSEDDYWRQMDSDLGPSGVPPADAEKLIGLFTGGMKAEGMEERTALLTMLHLAQAKNMAPHETMLHGLETAARLVKEIQAVRAGGGLADDEDPSVAAKRMLKIMNVPFQNMTDTQLKEQAVREFSFLDRLTEMSYYKSNNWAALPGASDDELLSKGVWIGIVSIRVMLVKEDRVDDIKDLDEKNLAAVQKRINSAHETTKRLVWQERERDLKEELEEARADEDKARIAEIEEQLPRERAAVLKGNLKLYFRDFGENCYVLRLVATSPDNLRVQASGYSARLRNGRAIVDISLAGNFPESEMTKVMDHFLSEMDARTNIFFE